MSDITRQVSRNMQRGIRGAKEIKCGPLSLIRTEYPNGTAWGLLLWLGRYALNVSLTRAEEEFK
jgi:hypothetical protein